MARAFGVSTALHISVSIVDISRETGGRTRRTCIRVAESEGEDENWRVIGAVLGRILEVVDDSEVFSEAAKSRRNSVGGIVLCWLVL